MSATNRAYVGNAPLNVGIVGTGSIGIKAHLPAWSDVDEARIVAVADPDVQAREDAIGRLESLGHDQSRAYESLEKMVETEELDLVDITVRPPDGKASLIEMALKGGCHVTCQKPFLHDFATAERLVELAEREDRILSVNQQARFAPAFARGRDYVTDGEVGTLRTIQLTSDFNFPGEHRWLNFSSHTFDLVRFLSGKEPTRVLAWRKQQGDDDRYLLGVWLDFDGELAAHIWDELASSTTLRWRFRVMGSEGSVEGHEAYFDRMRTPRTAYTPVGTTASQVETFDERYVPDVFAAYFKAVVSSIRGEREPPTPGRDNLRTLRLAFAAAESFDTGAWVAPHQLNTGELSI